MLDEFAQAAGGMETPQRRSDTTESVYSSGPTPPASPKQALTRLNTERLHPNPAVGSLSPPSPVPAAPPSPQTPTYIQRDLQRQQEVRDRLSGNPGPKASSLIEMYREKERQAASSRGSPGKSADTSSQEQPTQPAALVAKETAPLALHHLRSSTCPFPLLTSLGWSSLKKTNWRGTEEIMWSRQIWILTMVGTAHSGIFTVPRYTTWWRRKRKRKSKVRDSRFRCVVCHT